MEEEQAAKYERVLNWIRTKIANGEWKAGDKIGSEYQLCKKFEVSRQTVRHAISILVEEGLLESRQGSGTYVKASVDVSKKEKPTMTVAVMTSYLQEYIFSAIIQQIEDVLSSSGYETQVSITNNALEKERLVLKNILKKNAVDGLIAEPTKSGLPNPNLDLYREIMKRGIPVLFLNSYYRELDVPHVSLNDRLAGKMATNHLIKCGHRDIAAILKADDGQGHARYQGYLEALMEADIRIRSSRVVWIDTDELKNLHEEAGWILKRISECSACMCYNDELASALVEICQEEGIRIPDDLSIIGIDDSNLASFCEVPLTSVRNPIQEVGRVAAMEMLELLKGGTVPNSKELEPEVVNRTSVKLIDELEHARSVMERTRPSTQ